MDLFSYTSSYELPDAEQNPDSFPDPAKKIRIWPDPDQQHWRTEQKHPFWTTTWGLDQHIGTSLKLTVQSGSISAENFDSCSASGLSYIQKDTNKTLLFALTWISTEAHWLDRICILLLGSLFGLPRSWMSWGQQPGPGCEPPQGSPAGQRCSANHKNIKLIIVKANFFIKVTGNVQRKLRWVENNTNRQVLLWCWGAGFIFYLYLRATFSDSAKKFCRHSIPNYC